MFAHDDTLPERDYFDGSGYDPETVRFFDVAHEGAHIRAVAGAVPRLEPIIGSRPRSVVIVSPDHAARVAARLAAALRAPLHEPVVVCESMPLFVGPLDLVVVVTDRGDDPGLACSLSLAEQRGCPLIFTGPSRGPLLDDVPSSATIIPGLPTTTDFSPSRVITTVGSVLDLLARAEQLCEDRLNRLADAVDEEVAALSPERDESVNPGRQLRHAVEKSQVIHTVKADGSLPLELAELVSALWSARGLASGVVAPEDLARAFDFAPSASASIFHDPYLDGPSDLLPWKAVVWGASEVTQAQTVPVDVDAARPVGPLEAALRLVVRALAAPTYSCSGASEQ